MTSVTLQWITRRRNIILTWHQILGLFNRSVRAILWPLGTPAQLCSLQVGDEIVQLGGNCVAKMSYEQWKEKMDAALREGKLLMDIRRQGLNEVHFCI